MIVGIPWNGSCRRPPYEVRPGRRIGAPCHGGATRYLDAVVVDGHWWICYEMTRADGAHDLGLLRVPAEYEAA
jgi:hypothetical protein